MTPANKPNPANMQRSGKPAMYSSNIRQFNRFIIVGFSNFAVSFAVFYLLYNYWQLSGLFYGLLGEAGRNLENSMLQFGAESLDATLANIVGYGAGIINSFIWNKLWTFRAKHETVAQFGRFLTLNFFCLLLSSTSLFLFTDYLHWPYLPVWFITMVIITIINFLGSRTWVFNNMQDAV
jgi:putative flippase GtrA